MDERRMHLDLLADLVVGKINELCGEDLHQSFKDEVLDVCGVEPNSINPDGRKAYEWAKHLYAEGLMDDVPTHIAKRWAEFRETEGRLHSAALLASNDDCDFDP